MAERRPALIALLGIALCLSVRSLAGVVSMPDPKKGAINGRVALAAVPVAGEHSATPRPLTTDNCGAHLVETQDETRERVYPCGIWFQPPVGRYLFWIEDRAAVSFQSVVNYAGERFRFLSLHLVKNYRPFDRRIATSDAKRPHEAPVGATVAGVFDRGRRALALSKPFVVKPGQLAIAKPETPRAGRAAVVVVLDRFEHPPLSRCEAMLMRERGRPTGPAVDLQAYDRLVMIWYDLLASPDVRITISCGRSQTFVQTLGLASGRRRFAAV